MAQSAFNQYGEDLPTSRSGGPERGGIWTVERQELGVPVPVIRSALDFRIQSLNNPAIQAGSYRR